MGLEQDRKYNQFKALFGEKLAKAYPQLADGSDAIFEKIAALDPTATAKGEKHRYLYLEWICARIQKSQPRQQDLYKIREDLEFYGSLARLDKFRASRPGTVFYRPYVEPQIGQYASLESLSNAVLPYLNLKDRKKSAETVDAERAVAEKNTQILYDGPEGRVVVPLTMEASQYWGKGTKWCISATKSDNLFEQYYKDGEYPIIMFLPKGTSEKFAFNEYDKAAARNLRDEAIYDTEGNDTKDKGGTEILADFVVKTFSSTDFAWDKVASDASLSRAVQLFAMLNPPIHHKMLSLMEDVHMPPSLRIGAMLSFAEEYLMPSSADGEQSLDNRSTIVNAFTLSLMRNEQVAKALNESDYARLTKLVGEENLTDTAIMNIISSILVAPDPALESADAYLQDYQAKSKKLEQLTEKCKGIKWDQTGTLYSPEILYLRSIPAEFWADKRLASAVLESTNMAVGELFDGIPQIFEHPESWVEVLSYIEILPDSIMIENAAQYPFPDGMLTDINGVSFLEIVAHTDRAFKGKVIDDLSAALTIYGAFGHVEGLDWTPIARRLADIYPDGFDDPNDVQMASTHMPKCDLSTILEKTVARHPEFFADVDPSSQTVAMVETAIRHDPEALADVADRFFGMPNRPPALASAFTRMVEMNSPFIGMVEQHFAPNGP